MRLTKIYFLTIAILQFSAPSDQFFWEKSSDTETKKCPTIVSIGRNWINLTWNTFDNITVTCNDTIVTDVNVKESSIDIHGLIEGITYNCSMVTPGVSCVKVFTPGTGNATDVVSNNTVFAHFIGDKSSCNLTCTIMYEGYVQTDTVWSIERYGGIESIQTISNSKVFNIGDVGVPSSIPGVAYGNHLDILDCSVRDLNGATIYCGSYVNPKQAFFNFTVCEQPEFVVDEVIQLEEGKRQCSVTVIIPPLMTRVVGAAWKKDGQPIYEVLTDDVTVDGVSITFNEVKQEHAGVYSLTSDISCHNSSTSSFSRDFTLEVVRFPEVFATGREQVIHVGDQASLVCGRYHGNNPNVNVKWLDPRGNQAVDDESHVKGRGPSGEIQMHIVNASTLDNGTWTCTVESLDLSIFQRAINYIFKTEAKHCMIDLIVVSPPSEPYDTHTEAVNSSIFITWSQSLDLGHPPMSHYEVCLNGTCDTVDLEMSLNINRLMMMEGHTYLMTVRAISGFRDVVATSPPSRPITFTMDHVRDLKVVEIGLTWVYLSWRAFPLFGDQQYAVVCNNSKYTTAESSINITGLLSGSTYLCEAMTVWGNSVCSLQSPPIHFTPGASRVPSVFTSVMLTITVIVLVIILRGRTVNYAIATPSRPKVLIISDNSVELSWTVSGNNATSFTVLYRQRSDPTDQWNNLDTKTTRVTIHNLSNDAVYTFKVRAVHNGKYGQYSKSSEAKMVCHTSATRDSFDPVLVEDDTEAQKQPALIARDYSKRIKNRSHGPNLYDPVTQRKNNTCIIIDPTNKNPLTVPMQEKILLLVGATGAGKSTLINGIANFVLGVDWEHDFRFVVTANGRSSQAQSQTKKITAYTFVGSILPYTLTVIDTPGFGDTRGIQQDEVVLNQIHQLFSESAAHYNIDQIHGIGFVVSATDARLSQIQKYVFNSILSIFGKNIASSIFMLMTFADGDSPPLLSALKEANIHYKAAFPFNNCALYVTNNDSDIDELYWKLGMDSFRHFFSKFEKAKACSLQLTRETLKMRQQLEAQFSGLKVQIRTCLTKIDALHQKMQVLQDIKSNLPNKIFTYDVTIAKHRQISLSRNKFVTNCRKCNFTCHYPCPIKENSDKYECVAMSSYGRGDAYCTVCPGNCHWSEHVNQPYYFEIYYESEIMSDDTDIHYGKEPKRRKQIETAIASIEHEIDVWSDYIIQKIKMVQQNQKQLQKLALKPGFHGNVDYVEFLVSGEKSEMIPGYNEHIQTLKQLKEILNKKRVRANTGSNQHNISLWQQCIS